MSRIGKKTITFESDVTVSMVEKQAVIEGPKGKVLLEIPDYIILVCSECDLHVTLKDSSRKTGNIQGLYRTLLQNAVLGVKTPWTKTLELVGVGYRAQTQGNDLVLNLGFSHPINIKAPQGISFQVIENKIIVTGVDKYHVGETAAKIRRLKEPEPYKGKGIRYQGEYIRKKLGKAAKAVGAPGGK